MQMIGMSTWAKTVVGSVRILNTNQGIFVQGLHILWWVAGAEVSASLL